RVARRHVQLWDERAQAQQQRGEIAQQLEQEKSKLAMLIEQDRDLAPRMQDAQYIYDNAERSLPWAQSTQQSRDLFKKLLHGAADQAKVDELTQELEQAQQVYEEISQQHDALAAELEVQQDTVERLRARDGELEGRIQTLDSIDRKSTRLNSSHVSISDAGFCWKKKNEQGEGRVATDVARLVLSPPLPPPDPPAALLPSTTLFRSRTSSKRSRCMKKYASSMMHLQPNSRYSRTPWRDCVRAMASWKAEFKPWTPCCFWQKPGRVHLLKFNNIPFPHQLIATSDMTIAMA